MREKYFLERKTCRKFKSGLIDPLVLKNIIMQAMKAPTCGEMQLYSVIVTQEKDNLKKLAEFHYNQPASVSAPVILTVCADFNRFQKWCEINNAKAAYKNFYSFITAMTDALIFAQQLVTVAESEGFGTCYLGTVTYNVKEISELLKMPDLVIPVASIALGIPDEEGNESKRLNPDAVVHFEKYNNPSNEDIKHFYEIYDSDIENDKYIKENKKNNLAQVFAEVRYPMELFDKLSDSFLQHINSKGFKSN